MVMENSLLRREHSFLQALSQQVPVHDPTLVLHTCTGTTEMPFSAANLAQNKENVNIVRGPGYGCGEVCEAFSV